MCTVLQQHLARQMTNGFSASPTHNGEANGHETDNAIYARTTSPIRLEPNNTTYSYLGAAEDGGFSMKRQIEPYDRKKSAPAHFHVPPNNPDGTRPSSRARNAYRDALWGRSRSHSRTGMRVMLAEMDAHSTPRPKSPHMNNEEPISFSHYPDGHPPNGNDEVDEGKRDKDNKKKRRRKKKPIERDDFPAPPFPYARRRHWSEPMKSSSSETDSENEEEIVQVQSSSEEEDVPDPKLDQTENELKKISTGMASVFLVDLEKERIRRKSAKSTKFIDPRSAARTPAANRCPPFRLRYDSPVNASPSRIADHLRPWDDDVDGITSRRSFFSATPFLPSTPGLVGGRISTTSPKGRKSSTLPSRNSPAHPGGPLTYSTDFSTDISDGEGGGKDSTGTPMAKPVRVSSAYAPTPPGSGGSHMNGTHGGGGSLPNMPPSSLAATDDEEDEYIPQVV